MGGLDTDMRLLLVEDNRRIASLICLGLQERGFAIDPVHSVATAESALATTSYDALILDLGLPDGDGLAWMAQGRRAADFPPVLMLTARSGLEDRVAGLDAGADDYLTKPFELDEVAARLRALLRRPGARSATLLEAHGVTLDVSARKARVGDTALSLTRREFDLLELLMRRADAVVSKDAIESALYSFNEPVTPNAVEALASRLRRKLGDAGAGELLQTVRGVGYMIEGMSP